MQQYMDAVRKAEPSARAINVPGRGWKIYFDFVAVGTDHTEAMHVPVSMSSSWDSELAAWKDASESTRVVGATK